MYIIERFFSRLHQKIQEKRKESLRLKNEEVWRLMDVRSPPGEGKCATLHQPSPQLAKIAAMSETRLKTNFKKIYGSNIYALLPAQPHAQGQGNVLTGIIL
jgi:hypothetical protein